jgi:hypothetical protein
VLGDSITTINNLSLANVAITSVSTAFPNGYLANSNVIVGTTTLTLGSTVTSINGLSLSNVTISSGNVTISNVTTTNVSATTANVSGTANVSSLVVLTNETVLGNTAVTGNVTASINVTGAKLIPTGTSVTGNGLYLPAANALGLSTNGTNAVYIDASQNVGIGTASPSYRLDVAATTAVVQMDSSGGTAGAAVTRYKASNRTWVTGVNATDGTGTYTIYDVTASAERMRIDSSGNLTIGGTTSVSRITSYGTTAYSGYSSAIGAWASANYNSASSGQLLGILSQFTGYAPNDATSQFFYGLDTGGLRFAVKGNGGISNYSANNTNLSDRREKTNFAPAGDYLAKICAIPVQTFNYIDQNLEEDDGLTLGVVAQDVQAVAPELVIESNWGTIEEPRMRLSIYQTDLQYALMKCIQEQQALITALTARITALEAK